MDPRPGLPAPAQLPPPGFFADRRDELTALRGLAERMESSGGPGLVVITGAGGIGKTALALHWLHQIREEYDGQLFADLRGFSDGEPVSPGESLERFLRALDVPAENIPVNMDEQMALFRSLTAGRRLIIMLDNAVSAAQVRPLLPGAAPALVVVTTRLRLTGLAVNGARFLDLAPLQESGALELLDHIIGSERIQAEPSDARSLVTLCGQLPLAVCASGARLVARSRWSLSRMVTELTDEKRRLAALCTREEDLSVQAVFNTSYAALPDDQARVYRLLGIHPGTDFGVAAAAALIGLEYEPAGDLLDDLVDASLLSETTVERYRFHDLVRLHARGKAEQIDSETERRAAFHRLADWQLTTAVAADLTILPGRWHLGGHYADEHRSEAVVFEDRTAALAWLEMERSNLIAVIREAQPRGLPELAWQICEAMWPLFLRRKHYRAWLEAYELGLAAAKACADAKAQARMLEGLGMAYLNLKDFPEARRRYRQAIRLEQEAGHQIGEASALEGLGIAELATGRQRHAVEFFTQAQRIHQTLDRPRGVALMRRHIGGAFLEMGRPTEAIEQLSRALRIFVQLDEPYHQARTLTGLGRSYLLAGRLDEAAETLSDALDAARQTGARHEEAAVQRALARLAEAQGSSAAEHHHLQQALEIYSELGAPQVSEVRSRIAEILPASSDRSPDPPQ